MASSTAGTLCRRRGKKRQEAHSLHPFLWQLVELWLDTQRRARPCCRVAEHRPSVSCSRLVPSEHPHCLLLTPFRSFPSVLPQPCFSISLPFFVSGVPFDRVAPAQAELGKWVPVALSS